jgi:hypothetical protein
MEPTEPMIPEMITKTTTAKIDFPQLPFNAALAVARNSEMLFKPVNIAHAPIVYFHQKTAIFSKIYIRRILELSFFL